MLTPEQQAAAAAAAAGANDGKSPNPQESAKQAESLRAAQDAAEAARKETAGLKTMLEERDAQTQELKDRMDTLQKQLESDGKLKKGAKDPVELGKQLRKLAEDGDIDAIATLEAARQIAREEFSSVTTEQRMNDSLDKQERFLAEKSRDAKMTVKELIDAIDPHAAAFTNRLPHEQAELAFAAWQKVKGMDDREAKITAREKELGLFREGGSDAAGPETTVKKDGPAAWRGDKTPAEKRASLGSL